MEESEEHENLCISGIGYFPNTISMLLEDIDECSLLPGKCEGGNCVNHEGGYTCTCPRGYELIGNKCHDIDECEEVENPCEPGLCINKIGAHNCVCPENYVLSQDGRQCEDNRMGSCFRLSEFRNICN